MQKFVPTNPGTEGLVKGVLSKQPTATSSRCRGSLTQEATQLDKFYAILMMTRNGVDGVTIASPSRFTIAVGKLKLLDQFRRVSETVSGHRL